VFTHIGIAILKTGLSSNVYQIGIILYKAVLTIDKILERTQVERNAIIMGKVIDPEYVPCFAVLNRGRQTQCILGPNRIYYEPLNGIDYRILLPQNYC
jgi:hypothetical protein